jgi:hypothetical protein
MDLLCGPVSHVRSLQTKVCATSLPQEPTCTDGPGAEYSWQDGAEYSMILSDIVSISRSDLQPEFAH